MIEIKNSSTHESEENEMRKFVTKMEEYICDKLCRKPHEVPDQNSMDSTCTECRIQEFADQILEQYEKYDGIIKCNECVYQAHEKSTDSHWCRLSMGLDGVLQPEDGCSRGKRSVILTEKEKLLQWLDKLAGIRKEFIDNAHYKGKPCSNIIKL